MSSYFNHLSTRGPATLHTAPIRNETTSTGILSQRSLPSNAGRILNDQRPGSIAQSPLHIGTNQSTNTFTARNTAPLFQEKIPIKQSVDQLNSAFHRPPGMQKDDGFNQPKIAPQILLTPQASDIQTLQKPMVPRPLALPDIYQCKYIFNRKKFSCIVNFYSLARTINDTNVIDGKVRVKMQVIKANTIWHNADVPIIDHPSAFFVCNQDPRIAEQFSLLSIEMK